MIHRLLVVMCLLLALATLVLWISLPPLPGIDLFSGMPPAWEATRYGGGLHVEFNECLPNAPSGAPRSFGPYYYSWKAGVYRNTRVYLPLWAPLSLLCIYPAVAFARGPYRRYRRGKKGLCLKCGYNLTGNVSGICPECGEKVEAGTAPKG